MKVEVTMEPGNEMMQRVYKLDELCPYVREVGLQRRDAWRTTPRKIYDHQMLYCFVGSANIVIEDTYYKINKGNLFIIPPDKSHLFWVNDDSEGELYWCHYDYFFYEDREWHRDIYDNPETYLTLFKHDLPHKEHVRTDPVFENDFRFEGLLQIKNQDLVEHLFRMLHQNFRRCELLSSLKSKLYFLDILHTIIMESNFQEAKKNKEYVVSLIKSYIDKNYYQKISVQDICRETGLNQDYASKLFKKITGMNVVEYLNKLRVEKAKKLFLDMDLSISDISEMVGFSNANYFCTVVKKIHGKSPQKIRTELLNLIFDSTD